MQIVTSDGEAEKHYMAADGSILGGAEATDDMSEVSLMNADENQLVISDDGQQVHS